MSNLDEIGPDPNEAAGESTEPTEEEEGFHGTPWSRRTFLKAAALGTAAAAVFQKGPGLSFGPAAAYANDLSHLPCTAQDVEILGTGVTLNEPCTCTSGTFTAVVQFQVKNNTNTGRYCVALHIPGGFSVPAQDVILRDALTGGVPSGSSTVQPGTTTMYGSITGFPCNTGGTLVCLGQAGVVRGKCDPGTCVTLAWTTSPNAAGCTQADQRPPGGQCRHQQICIQGFGATLDCDPTTSAVDSSCSIACGQNASLKLCVAGGTSPYVFRLYKVNDPGPNETFTLLQTFPTTGTDAGPCHTFSQLVTETTTFEGRVTDSAGCVRTARTTVSTTSVTPSLGVSGTGNCDGILTFSVTGLTGTCTLTYKVDGTTVTSTTTTDDIHLEGTGKDQVLKYRKIDSGGCHTIFVESNCGGCTGSDSMRVKQCVTSTAQDGACPFPS